jgi:hypothetical protein
MMLGAPEGACFAFELEMSNESHTTWIGGAKVAVAEAKSVRGMRGRGLDHIGRDRGAIAATLRDVLPNPANDIQASRTGDFASSLA